MNMKVVIRECGFLVFESYCVDRVEVEMENDRKLICYWHGKEVYQHEISESTTFSTFLSD